ncbi:MAG TPA: PP2C family protein-serine/threonine phosphatase [Anaerolineae bacterium]|jgi:serine phosphatase RsbU (regulator of sigma subunit)
MELQVAVAKVSKYAVRESGDTLEMIERPHGGLSFVLVDGQHTGHGAKQVSNLVAHKAISLLAEGVRDGAAARAAHDYLYTHYDGKVSAELQIVSIDLVSKTIVISRNSHCPAIVGDARGIRLLDQPSEAIGVHRRMKPVIAELPLEQDASVVVFTDGVLDAGVKYGQSLDVVALVETQLADPTVGAQALANAILARAVELDRGRSGDDTSVLVVRVVPRTDADPARRLAVRFPID